MVPPFPDDLRERERVILEHLKENIRKILPSASSDRIGNVVTKRSHRTGGGSKKFSLHFIWPDIVFEDINNVGAFVRRILTNVGKDIPDFINDANNEDAAASYPLLGKIGNDVVCLIDSSVYSFNQNLRLLNCTKWGEDRYFTTDGPNNAEIFAKTCIGGFPSNELITFNENDGTEALNTKSPFVTLKMNLSKMGEFRNGEMVMSKVRHLVLQKSAVEISGYEYFENEKSEGYLVFRCRSKHCSIAGKEHASNKIYYVLNCQTMSFYQKCHDEDCANQRGEEIILII
jgi:hypothetical protein